MPRSSGIGRTRLTKKQKVSNVGKDYEESANSNKGGINSQCGENEYEDYDELDYDSISNNCYLLKNPKVGSDSYHDLSKTTQRAVQHACDR
eukprot:8157776-Ditylum_brightwellii.AAC.1